MGTVEAIVPTMGFGQKKPQRSGQHQLVAAVERLTGRRVRTFLSGSSTLGESAVEVFVLESDQGADATRPR